MAGDPLGDAFDESWEAANDRAQAHKARGETVWATDKYLERINRERDRSARRHAANEEVGLLRGLLRALRDSR